jgi:hypothetical protein
LAATLVQTAMSLTAPWPLASSSTTSPEAILLHNDWAEALRFLRTAEQHRLYALWAVALAMGLRRGEALGLEWADVNLDAGANDDQASIAPSGWAVEARECQNGRFGGDSAAGRADHPAHPDDVIYDIATTLKLRRRHLV